MNEKTYRATLPSGVCGAVSVLGDVVSSKFTAPVFSWALGKPFEELKKWVLSKGGTVVELRKGGK